MSFDSLSRLTAPITRRALLRRCTASLLPLALGNTSLMAPSARATSKSGFRFAVLNDLHYVDARCGAFLKQVTSSIAATPEIDFCLLAGDLSDHGLESELLAVREIFSTLQVPIYTVPGNHDYHTETDRTPYDNVFPESVNYHFQHKGWQFLGLDTTDGQKWQSNQIDQSTIHWLDSTIPTLDPSLPTVAFTHFPLGVGLNGRPSNADTLLAQLARLHIHAVYSGHNHLFSEQEQSGTVLLTNRCCAISAGNSDDSPQKGYFLCETSSSGVLSKFIEVPTT